MQNGLISSITCSSSSISTLGPHDDTTNSPSSSGLPAVEGAVRGVARGGAGDEEAAKLALALNDRLVVSASGDASVGPQSGLAYHYPSPPVYPTLTPTLHKSPIAILSTPSKGRGVFATEDIKLGTVIDISPVLLLSKEEYYGGGREGEGKGVEGSVLRGYVFSWKGREGGMALALGIGSLFNHSITPNVSFQLNLEAYTITYTAFRRIAAGEELCIFYGHRTRFDKDTLPSGSVSDSEDEDSEWGRLSSVVSESSKGENKIKKRWDEEIVPFPELDWVKVTAIVDPEDQQLTTLDCYAIDVLPHCAPLVFEFARKNSTAHQRELLHHLKRVRREPPTSEKISVLLFPVDASGQSSVSTVQELVDASKLKELEPQVYVTQVPATVARTEQQGREWGAVWPVTLVHIREGPKALPRAKGWEKVKMGWVKRQAEKVWKAAFEAGQRGEHPIACRVTEAFDPLVHSPSHLPATLVQAHDTRQSTRNPLSHAASNAIDAVASLDRLGLRSSTAYLLTGLSVFMTHEPCLLCSMSLLHSRISTLYFIKAAAGSGGCGSVYGVHEDGGLNHRFEVWQWRGADMKENIEELRLDP